jgi:hypothetical protein
MFTQTMIERKPFQPAPVRPAVTEPALDQIQGRNRTAPHSPAGQIAAMRHDIPNLILKVNLIGENLLLQMHVR